MTPSRLSGAEPAARPEVGGRILADSSMWIEFYRPRGREEIRLALTEAIAGDRVATMATILIEVLRGALTRESYRELEEDFGALHWLQVTTAVARGAAQIGFDLDRRGQRVPTTGLLIASTAIEYGCTLWHDDGHFETIARASPLAQRRFAPDL